MSYADVADVYVEVASLSGSESGGLSGWWQPDSHAPKNWMPDDATIETTGYGVWVDDNVPTSGDWSELSWYRIHCDLMDIGTTTGLAPYEWNASAGALTLQLWDAAIIYTPFGPVGVLDDLDIDTPIRVRVEWTDWAPRKRSLWSGLVRSITHAVTIDGTHLTTIQASEVIEVYGRTNPLALASDRPTESLTLRTEAIHNRSDRPGIMPKPMFGPSQAGYPAVTGSDLSENLWTEMCLSMNSRGLFTTALHYNGTPVAVGIQFMLPPSDPVLKGWADALVISRECSDPNGPPRYGSTPPWTPIKVSPFSLSLNTDLAGLANYVDLVAVSGPAATRQDVPSIDRYGKHSFTRRDLLTYLQEGIDQVADAAIARLGDGTSRINSVSFPISCVRDLIGLVGVREAPLGIYPSDVPAMQPGRWMSLRWEEPDVTAYLMVTSVEHSITAGEWSVTLSGELHAVVTAGE